MNADLNPDAIELPECFPLKEDVLIHDRNGTNQHFVVEDPENGRFFRIGEYEREFLLALRESGSASKAHQRCSDDPTKKGMSLEKAERFCKWLHANGLIASSTTAAPVHAATRSPLVAAFFWKVPLVNPDRWLCSLNQRCGWLFSPPAMLVALIVFFAGVLATTGKWDQFLASYENLFSSWRWLSIGLSWVILKVVHETAHGATCRRYGGEVREAGIAMILLMPIAFVNVTSSWRFPSRWQRLHVTLAGVLVELLVAGVALIAWNSTESMPLRQAAADVVLMASVSSILFNLNPLLKFDGYFALADLSGVDNLYSYGQAYARYFGGRYLLGLQLRPPQLPGRHGGWIKWYGCSAAIYRVFTVAGLLFAAAAIFHGAGIVIAVAGVVTFVIKPATMLVRHLYQLWRGDQLHLSKLMLRLSCIGIFASTPFWLIPASGSWTSPAVVLFSPSAVLRARSPGFVTQVHVVDGQAVKAGTPIVTMSNDELQFQLMRQKTKLAQVEQEVLAAQWLGKSTELADAQTRRAALRQQLEVLQQEVDQLVVRAPVEGRVISRKLAMLPGTFVNPDDELAVIGREDSKRLVVSISQNEARFADEWKDKPVKIILDGCPTWDQRLTRIETRADTTPVDESLLAINGGPLAAVQKKDRFVLCEPRVNGIIELSPQESEQLACGQFASVLLSSDKHTLGGYFVRRAWRLTGL